MTNLVNGLGGAVGFGENFVPRNDDSYSGLIDLRAVLPQGLNFFGTVYTSLYVNNNGSVTFVNGVSQYTPSAITGASFNPMIAPFWADVDTRPDVVTPTPGGTSAGSNLVWYDLDAANGVFTVTWDDVGYYSNRTDLLNAFQLQLIEVGDAGDFDIVFRYETMNWTTGGASGGVNGLGGTLARAGYTSGNGVNYFEMPQSGNQAALLNLENLSNVGTPGLFVFQVRNGLAAPTLSIGDVAVVEGNGAPVRYAVVPVQLAAAAGAAIAVQYTTIGGTAVAGQDFISQSGVLTFAPGVTQQYVIVELIGDAVLEADENFSIVLSNASGTTITDQEGVVTIQNDDGFYVSDVTQLEGTGANPTAFVFTVSLLTALAAPVSVNYATVNGSAAAGTDFTAASGTLTFNPGETTKTVTVLVTADGALESNETFTLQLSAPTGSVIADASGLGTIVNDDGVVIDDLQIVEGTATTTGTANLTVRLLTASATPVSVNWATSPGTAGSPSDFTASSGTVSFAAGQTSQTISVPIVRDSAMEGNETFTVTLTGAPGTPIADNVATVTIIDDDGFSISDVTINEGTGGSRSASFTVTLASALTSTATVDFATSSGSATAGSDFTAGSGTVTFLAGQTTATINVPIVTDATPEADETFSVTLSNPSAGVGIRDAVGVATLFNDDGLSINNVTVTEGNSGTVTATATVTLSGASAQTVTVNWSTADGTAGAGADYVAASGLLTFAPGDVSETISVTVNGDILYEPNETFRIVLSDPVNSALVDPSGTVTISNDDVQPLPALTISNVSASEGTAGGGSSIFYFPVTLSRAAASSVTVNYAVTAQSATAGSDFIAASGTLTIPAGQVLGLIEVAVVRDALDEANETFTVTLSAPSSNATIAVASATGTIINDDSISDDLLVSTAANEVLDGGGGNDTVTYAGVAQSVFASLALGGPQNTGGGGVDTLISIENLIGSSFGDTLIGDGGANSLLGGGGDDVLEGGLGDDSLNGGDGSDTASYQSAAAGVDVNLALTTAQATGGGVDVFTSIENLRGSAFADVLRGDRNANVLSGGNGADWLSGGDALPASTAGGQIFRLYRTTLDRSPDAAGYVHWEAQLQSGVTLEDMAATFINSGEFQVRFGGLSTSNFVTQLYETALQRAPDASGLAAWTAQIDSGAITRADAVLVFSESGEAQVLADFAQRGFLLSNDLEPSAGQVFRLYRTTLDRLPDEAGFNYWTEVLAGPTTLAEMSATFINSGEFQARFGSLSTTAFVTQLYDTALLRAPDQAGLDHWVAQINAGLVSRDAAVLVFSESFEAIAISEAALADFYRTSTPSLSDTLEGGLGDDWLLGGRGADTFVFDADDDGADHVFGLEAIDTLRLIGFGYGDAAEALTHFSQTGFDVLFQDDGVSILFHATDLATVQQAEILLA